MTTTESDFLYVEEIAQICRAPRSSVRYWLNTGKLASIRPGKRLLVRRKDLEEFIRAAAQRRGNSGGVR